MKGRKTNKQLADLQEKRNALLVQIRNWREVQLVYTPHVASLISHAQPPETNADPVKTLPETIPLFMPSTMPPQLRALPELKKICQLERRLREPQADGALAEVRHQRRVIQGLWQFKRLNISGMGNKPNTRMITLYKHFDKKTCRAAEKYRTAWSALCVLDPDGSWSVRLKELKREHISGPGKEPDDSSNSRYQPSWIWLVPCASGLRNVETTIGEDEFNKSMQVEWSKARARMRRWNEELLIIKEEMRRAIVYHKWRAAWWRERSLLREHADATILSGISGYAHKQATICTHMAERCAVYWLPHLKEKGFTPVWASDYEHFLHEGLDDGVDVSKGEGEYEGDEDGVEGDLDLDEDEVDGEVDLDEDYYFDLDIEKY